MNALARNLPYLLALVAGGLLPLQTAFNGRLGRVLGNPALAALVSFAVGTVLLALYVGVSRLTGGGAAAGAVGAGDNGAVALATAPIWTRAPAWVWFGGAVGAFYVTVVTLAAPRIGGANVVGLVTAGQVVVAVLLDHFGLFGLPTRPLSVARLAGIALVVAGVLLVQRSGEATK